MTNREMFEQIQENAPHLNAIRYALNELEAATLTARDVYNCTNVSEYLNDAEECAKIAAALDDLYAEITHREGCHLHESTTKHGEVE